MKQLNRPPLNRSLRVNFNRVIAWFIRPRRWVDTAVQALLVVTVFCVFVPLTPQMPSNSLDGSWLFAVNEAVAKGARFGTDLVFTYGPYAAAGTGNYHPGTDQLMLAGSAFLALCYSLGCWILMRGRPWPWVLFYSLAMAATLAFARDVLYLSMVLLMALATKRWVEAAPTERRSGPLAMVALLMSSFGLLPLVKGTFLAFGSAVCVVCVLYFLSIQKVRAAAICVVTPVISMPFFWLLAGQSVADLPAYLLSMLPIVSGYTEAMALPGRQSDFWNYLIAATALLLYLLIQKACAGRAKIFLLVLFALFLFIVFKSGFVRHDAHVFTAASGLLLAALLMACVVQTRWMIPLSGLMILSFVNILHGYTPVVDTLLRAGHSTYASAWNGLSKRTADAGWPRKDFDAAVLTIKKSAAIALLPGTTDIYSFDQSQLIASGNTWNQRPVLQSYSAYTPELAEINRQHLLGPKAPDNILFRLQAIDLRFPTLDDGPSWPVLLAAYQPVDRINETVYLRRRPATAAQVTLVDLQTATHALGSPVPVPQNSQPLFVEMDIQRGWFGKLVALLFKPSRLEIQLELERGERKTFRLIAGMAQSPFLLSPLVEDSTEFGLLFSGGAHLQGKRVKSFSVQPVDGPSWFWNDTYVVTFRQVQTPPALTDSAALRLFDTWVDDAGTRSVTATAPCQASVDVVNGAAPAAAQFAGSASLRVSGWLASQMEPAAVPDAVLLVLRDAAGVPRFAKTNRTPRPDVAAHFKQPALAQSGYTATLDVSALKGAYSLGLAFRTGDRVELCPNFNIAAVLGPAVAAGAK